MLMSTSDIRLIVQACAGSHGSKNSRRPRQIITLKAGTLLRRGVGKNGGKTVEKPIQTPPSRHNHSSSVLDPHLVDELQLRSLQSYLHFHDQAAVVAHNGHVNDLVKCTPPYNALVNNLVQEPDDLHVGQQLRNLHSFLPTTHDLHNNGQVNNPVQELDSAPSSTICTTRTSTILSTHCSCRSQRRVRQQPCP